MGFNTSFEDVCEAVFEERVYQEEKYGVEGAHHPYYTWESIIRWKIDELAEAHLDRRDDTVKKRLVQIAAVAIAALEDKGLPEKMR